MRITSSLPAFHEKPVSSGSGQIADERREKSLAIAEQLDRIGRQFKASSLLTRDNQEAAAQKAAVLKQRLDRLKAMMRFATPELAKSLARELKGIAKELASLGRAAGASGSGTTTSSAAPGGEVAVDPSAGSASPTEDATATAAADTGGSVDSANALQGRGVQNAEDDADAPGADRAVEGVGMRAGADDKSLRELIQEARKLLKELIARVKSLARNGDAEARRDLRAAEGSVAELDRALDPGGIPIAAIAADGDATPAVGGTIDVSA